MSLCHVSVMGASLNFVFTSLYTKTACCSFDIKHVIGYEYLDHSI